MPCYPLGSGYLVGRMLSRVFWNSLSLVPFLIYCLSGRELLFLYICILYAYAHTNISTVYILSFLFRVLKKDPYHTECLPIHISCLVELKESNSKLMEFFPVLLLI